MLGLATMVAGLMGALSLAGMGCGEGPGAKTATTKPPAVSPESARIDGLIREAIASQGLKAVIVQVTVDGRPVITKAYGESLTGVPAAVDMHFRNGAVAISYMSTLLLRLVDDGKVRLDDPVSKFLPRLRDGDRVTLRMLAGMTAATTTTSRTRASKMSCTGIRSARSPRSGS